jgi:hypothetical protein
LEGFACKDYSSTPQLTSWKIDTFNLINLDVRDTISSGVSKQ